MTRFYFLILFILFVLGNSALAQVPAECPSLKVIGPSGITTPGDSLTFVADTNADTKELKFYWTVSGGVIEEGQGTTAIKVRTSRDSAGKTIEATIYVQGFEDGCRSRAWETGPIADIPEMEVIDEFSDDLEPNDIRSRMDAFFLYLQHNPTYIGYIVIQIWEDEELSESNPRFQLLVQHITFRKFDGNRIRFMFEPIAGPKTRYRPSTRWYSIPPGGEDPPCDKCIEVHPIPLQ